MVIMFFIFHVYGNICGIGGVFYNFLGQGKAGEKALHYFVSEMDIRRYTIRILTFPSSMCRKYPPGINTKLTSG
ncbi:hypothetical protein C5S39_08885 [Candidatus Methanophagaceae archaeon]|nr:hypothetical protein C5S39_08885 [Methanophagales archaeon]